MSNDDLIQIIIERVAANSDITGAAFYWDEVKHWPEDKVAFFEKIGLLQVAQPMTDIECEGCEESCIMPVNIYPASEATPARAFIVCDKRDDIGRVTVNFDRLKQWQVTGLQLAQFVASLCELTQQVVKDADYWRLGMLQGKAHKAPVLMGFENMQPVIKVAGHSISLLEALLVDDEKCRIDLKKLKSFVDSPSGLADDKESAEARQDRLLARKSELKAKGIRSFNQQIADEEGMSLANVKKLIKAAEDRKKAPVNKWMQILGK